MIPKHKRFFSVNGHQAETLSDLKQIITRMSSDDFHHHTNGRNDFANWIKNILHMDFLAEKVQKTNSKEEVLSLIEEGLMKEKELLTVDNFKRVLAKDFIYGLLLGILIGLLLDLLI